MDLLSVTSPRHTRYSIHIQHSLSTVSTHNVRPGRYSISSSSGTRKRSHGSGECQDPKHGAFESTYSSFLSILVALLQSAPGKSSQAIPDEQQRGGVFGSGENKGSESGQAGDSHSGAGNLSNVSSLFSMLLAKIRVID